MINRGNTGKWMLRLAGALLLGAAVALAGCAGETPMPTPTEEEPEPTPASGEAAIECPFAEEWASSGHADQTAEAFTHWDEDDPPEIPPECAGCHSTPGYQDYLGADGSAFRSVDTAAPVGTVVTCQACHNEATMGLSGVVFPSGIEVPGLGDEARCMVCHQGRASTQTVNDAIAEVGVDLDVVSEDLAFVNNHYYAAAATQLGTRVDGGYQYEGKSYDARFAHVEEYETCIECHDPHALELRLDECAECHGGVAGLEDVRSLRLLGSAPDYDGDGDASEGVAAEIEGLQQALLSAIQAYATDVAGTAIAYDATSYPYFFIDANGNGEADEDEAAYPNRYASWTPRLLKAAYNYQTSIKDPGAFAHGGKYIIELLYDSIEDLDEGAVAGLTRTDAGHFDGSSEAWRHWDGEEDNWTVSAGCTKCHSAEGLPLYIEEGITVPQPAANGMLCSTCHDAVPEFTRYAMEQVTFPSGAALGFEDTDSNLCLNCHQGRQSTVSVNQSIEDAGVGPDEVPEDTDDLGFINVHYFVAGATIFGAEAQGAYEYEGQTYHGRFEHVDAYDVCAECHDAHALEVKVEDCGVCHEGVEAPEGLYGIRMAETDFDGDGDAEEGLAGEVETMWEELYAAIQSYATDEIDTPILYDSGSYPYFFIDTDGNGEADAGEIAYPNRYTTWTPRLLRAAYNLHYVKKDPGAFAHNGEYILQVLYDSISNVGGDTAGMTRP